MKKTFILLILLALSPLVSFPFKDIFSKADIGDYSIYQNGKSVTILNIHSKALPYITFEEITLPKKIYENVKGIDLNLWLKKGAKGNTSWSLIELNIDNLEVTSAFCFSRKTHLSLTKEDTLISSLLNLDIKKIPKRNLLRIGPRNGNKKDTREFWMPSCFVSGKKVKPKKMEVYGGTWGKDASPLSGKDIDLYLLNDFAFPYWIQIHGNVGSKKMVSLDSGKGLKSPISKIPKMPPKFLSGLEKWENQEDTFSFLIQGDRVISNYNVYILEIAKNNTTLIPVEANYGNIATHVLKFNISRDILTKKLISGKKYRLYLSYDYEGEIKSIVSKDIIHWK